MKNNKGFNHGNFKHSAFIYARNLVKWTHMSLCNKSYVKRRVDGTVYDEEDGFKSTFEAIVDKEGHEEEGYNFDDENKLKALLKIIKEYSSVLTEQQRKIFILLERGWSHEKIADKLNVTHQAISQQWIELRDKVRNHFNGVSLKDNSFERVSEGKKAITRFFEKSEDRITKDDRKKIESILLLNPNKYSSKDISEIFFSKMYNNRQIASCIVRKGWSSLLRKKTKPFNRTDELIDMVNNGISNEDISKKIGLSLASVRSRVGHLKRKKLLNNI